ncbi:MAG: HD domain-containing protein [candidate division Zixibacteria bacterium]|nr:HD domain-containing protein [candidate division Zixibacteria bacterium]
MKDLFVKDIKPGEKVTGYFALRKHELLEKDGRYRISAELGDSTGRIRAIMWDADPEKTNDFQAGDIVKVRGPVTTFQGRLQIRIDILRLAEEDEYEMEDFFRKASRTKDELSAGLDRIISKIENSYLKQLLEAVFGDEDIRHRYLESPAAKLLHHDTIGGLADHSLNMAEIVLRMADQYPKLDRDLLLCGALFHDIGKIWEYEVLSSIDFSDAGRLVGHINQGDEFITGKADSIEQFPENLLVHLRHLIISHQGEKAKGSPVVPQTPEALFLHGIDELDSKMGAIEKIRERTGNEGWSGYQQIFERFFYFGHSNDDQE